MKRRLRADELVRLRAFHAEKIESYLDCGRGECWLRRNDIASVVADAFKYFQGERYRLFAWCIMPNHVHVILQPLAEWQLSKIIHSWKSFTAKSANKLLKRSGSFWQSEYYDHLIRDREDFDRCIYYVWNNPGCEKWKWRWKAKIVEG